jgi:hypothetical protein
MLKNLLGLLLVLFLTVAGIPEPAVGQANILTISCEGRESGGGGFNKFQYSLMNPTATPVTLSLFYVGTMDLNPANYTNWVAPPGFTVGVVAPWIALPGTLSVMYTTQTKTPHGAMPAGQSLAAPGAVVWFGSAVMNPGQPLTFGFDNPHTSWDMEWLAEHPGGGNVTVATLLQPIAGPLGVFTRGYVHAPTTIPTAFEDTSFGRVKSLYR